MNRTRRFTAASALLAATMALPVAGWAQTQTAPAPAAPAQAEPSMNSTAAAKPATGQTAEAAKIQQGVEQHIKMLHRELHITAAEEPQWQQFTQVMRENARAMSDSLDQRAQQISSMTAVEDMTTYAQLATQRSQDLVKLATAFQTLYDTFPEQQKKQADQLFRQQAEAHAEKQAVKHSG